jgi:large subunit ribosomal protein L22
VETKAVARYIRISPRKARLVIDMIRGRDLYAAEQILDFSDMGAARVVSKVLRSAAANAENNNGIAPEALFVSKVFVDEGPTLKRFRPRAMGRATRINKRTCHITVILDEKEQELVTSRRRRRKMAAAEKAAAVTDVTETQPEAESEEPSDKDTAKKTSAKKPAAKKTEAKKPAAKASKPTAKPAAKKAAKPKPEAADKPEKKAAKPKPVTETQPEAESEEPSDKDTAKKTSAKKPAAKKTEAKKPAADEKSEE